ncbi:hypothetical protein C8Q77DRAFT_1161573 [Trametes polyzona]|nr:hypothetical protein C8Q77DRAFT_1161573 [Trametes polyzona]
MEGKVVVLPLNTFIEQFVSIPATLVEPVVQCAELDLSPVSVAVKSETAMYKSLMDALNHEWLLRKYIVHATPHKSDSNVASAGGIDGGLYPPDCVPEEADMTDWETIEVGIACKTEVSHDPVQALQAGRQQAGVERRRSHPVWHDGPPRAMGQAGVIFSESFDYVKGPTNIARFLWRYVRMTPEQQGHDTTATKVHPKSKDYELVLERAKYPLMIGGHKVGEHARREFAESTKDARWFWRLKVSDGKKAREFLVGRPHFIAYGLAGRGTKGFVAIDVNYPQGPLVYLKDVWRVAHLGMRREGDILAHLRGGPNDTPVKNVPTLVCHGDVGQQATVFQDIWKEQNPEVSPDKCPLKSHQHYRLVMEEVCLPISAFEDGFQLVFLIGRAIEAHEAAYRKGVLHRDISSGNVLIQVKEFVEADNTLTTIRDVLLADWELSKSVEEGDGGPRQPGRTGTWQFASARSLAEPSKEIGVEDEMESFFHLLLYLAIRYLPHNFSNVRAFMQAYFDGHHLNAVDMEYYGGPMKLTSMILGQIRFPDAILEFFARPLPPAPKTPAPGTDEASTLAQTQIQKALDDAVEPHRINDISCEMLAWLSAHYRLRDEEKRVAKASSRKTILKESTSRASTRQHTFAYNWADPEKTEEEEEDTSSSEGDSDEHPASFSRAMPPPIQPHERAHLEALAKNLGDHQSVLKLFKKVISRKKRKGVGRAPWYTDDKVPDQLPSDFCPGDERSVWTAGRSSRVPQLTSVDEGDKPLRKKPRTGSPRAENASAGRLNVC